MHYAFTTKLTIARGCATSLLQDRRRLVVVLFLLIASIWAKITFLSFAMPSPPACQATTAISIVFDQAARTVAAAILMDVAAGKPRSQSSLYTIRAVLAARFILGIVAAAFVRPQFDPICVARTASTAAAALTVGFDAAILTLVVFQAVTEGAWKDAWDPPTTTKKEQVKAKSFFIGGYILWFATSIPMSFGLRNVSLFVRTALPCVGLYVLILFIDIYQGALVRPLNDSLPDSPALESAFGEGPVSLRPESISDMSDRDQTMAETRGPLDAGSYSKPAPVITFRDLGAYPRNLTVTTMGLGRSKGPPPPAKDFPPRKANILPRIPERISENSGTTATPVSSTPLSAHPVSPDETPRGIARSVPTAVLPASSFARPDAQKVALPATPNSGLGRLQTKRVGPVTIQRNLDAVIARKEMPLASTESGPAPGAADSSHGRVTETTSAEHNSRRPVPSSGTVAGIISSYFTSSEPLPSNQTVLEKLSSKTFQPSQEAKEESPATSLPSATPLTGTSSLRGIGTGSTEVMKVWFVDDIVYDNPAGVESISHGRTDSRIARKPVPFSKDHQGKSQLTPPKQPESGEKSEDKVTEDSPLDKTEQSPDHAGTESVMNRGRVTRAGGGRAIFPRQESPELHPRKKLWLADDTISKSPDDIVSASESPSQSADSSDVGQPSVDETQTASGTSRKQDVLLPACYSPTSPRSATSATSATSARSATSPAVNVPFTPSGLPPPTPPLVSPGNSVSDTTTADSHEHDAQEVHEQHVSLPPTPSSSTSADSHSNSRATLDEPTSSSSVSSHAPEEQCVTFMLDPNETFTMLPCIDQDHRSPLVPIDLSKSMSSQMPWHLRPGDSPPTFSTRKQQPRRSKALPQLPPLCLRSSTGQPAADAGVQILLDLATQCDIELPRFDEPWQNTSNDVVEEVFCHESPAPRPRDPPGPTQQAPRLWEPPSQHPERAKAQLWSPSTMVPLQSAFHKEEVALRMRPMQRRPVHLLQIKSSALWSKPGNPDRPRVSQEIPAALESKRTSSQSFKPKAKRKSKRRTTLLDIIEDPEPIPGRSDSLGLFQAPWGPSDTTHPYHLLSPPRMKALQSPSLNAAALRLAMGHGTENELTDDDFDESTLWEIASLLCAQDVYSKSSMTPDLNLGAYDSEDEHDESEGGKMEHIYDAQPVQGETHH